jgi:hypothetical protein
MNKILLAYLPVALILSACSDNMYNKCIDAESEKLTDPAQLSIIQNQNRLPYYSPEISRIFKEFIRVNSLEADALYEFYDKHYYTEQLWALMAEKEKFANDEALSHVNSAESQWLADLLTYDQLKEEEKNCKGTPKCSVALEKKNAAQDAIVQEEQRIVDLSKLNFRTPRLKSQLNDALLEYLISFEKKDWIDLIDSLSPKMLSEYEEESEGRESRMSYNYALARVFLTDEYKEEEEKEKWPFEESRKRQLEYFKSGKTEKVVTERLSLFISKPSIEQISIQLCNERGLYN